ncbi:MAG: tRNA (N(6)-L-threonylcarbamoyladenosine(37)-C(2))-methylthiotransferase [Nanoarchaeota archaeon]|nr:tRNA (N(6)-L-threonylcarbamoyladenosine(37)-C(2))-methylthiotransferase [Nanoarchaeota archaeon]MBU1632387.1 tRNA (N(6)-L-threonylcarbamoyladenosine(37)-C(2))-methylthiotransferase [Nanoarchaeota archaeon]MBU1876691.1 tRNA (N(6)-L-threonylcarbamoyladenosine(37)-C(2))-methylthiotransferase [Nanoarchaeota archaeon]
MTKFHIITAGCSHNFADSEQMAGLLKESKFEPVDNLEEADVIIFNTCTVKGPTEAVFYKKLNEIKAEHQYKVIIIAGCIAQTDPEKLKKYPLIGTNQIHKIVEVIEEALNDNTIKMLEMGEMPPLNLPSIRKNPIIEIIPISRGCLGACTFCKTKSARGNLKSYTVAEIVERTRKAVEENVKEIWLTSQDNGCYGFDIGTDLPTLLQELIKITGRFKIRIGMMNPDHIPKIREKLIEVYQHEKIFKFLHLPIQSGNDQILEKMQRKHKVAEFKEHIRLFREAVPYINIMTDIIVGFPGETEEQYWDTLNLVRETTPDSINISRFWPRPKTPAAKLKSLPGEVIKHRSKVLTDIFNNITKMQNEKWLDWEGPIIIDEKGKPLTEENQWIGRNKFYKQVIVGGDFKLGDLIKVKIKKVGEFYLKGEIVS